MRRAQRPSGVGSRIPWVVLGICAAALVCALLYWKAEELTDALETSQEASRESPADWAERWQQMGELGRGFAVWESNRTGSWRIWYRDLDGSGLRRLSPEEEGRDHFAPHISPDGTHLVYLSYPTPRNAYKSIPEGVSVPLHLLRIEDGSDRVLVSSARSYNEDRAVVWLGSHELIYIDHRGITKQLELSSGEERPLTEEPQPKFGFLINPTMTHATTGRPTTFSLYDPEKRSIARRRAENGCQPYFSHDGRWGFWIEKNGGPVRRIDLVTGATGNIIARNDPRMPEGHRYLYFPMLSSCQRLIAFASSRSSSQHDHFRADYDVFVGRVDPLSLELVEEPVRYSFDPGTDRFPDVFLSGMELGHHRGEAPHSIALEIPDAEMVVGSQGPWRWDFGDGTSAVDETGIHTFERPGLYQVTASRGATELSGDVKVDPARPPSPKRVRAHDAGREVVVVFDEPIAPAEPELRFESGASVRDWRIAEDGRTLALHRDPPVESEDHLLIAGFVDRAQRPNPMEAHRLLVEPHDWPSRDDGLVFLWKTARDPNLVRDPLTRVSHTYELERHEKARLDHHHAMLVSGGYFRALMFVRRELETFRSSSAVTVEATIRPADREPNGDRELAGIVTLAHEMDEKESLSFALAQSGDELGVRLGTSLTGPSGSELFSLGRLSTSEPTHVVVSYRPGRLAGYLNGRRVLDTDAVQGDLTSWSELDLLQFGMGHGPVSEWDGTIEGVALYSRFMEAGEAAANARAYLELIAEREPVEQIQLRGKLVERSHVPTLKEIVPYREALVMYEYEVLEVLGGELGDETVRVAHWAILDGELEPIAEREAGEEDRLVLEPLDRNPQVENSYLSDTMELRLELPVYLDVDP
jgi:hypothetical protein